MNEQNKILEKLRTEIDSIDKNLLQLIEKRSNLASKIIKAKKGGDIFKPKREEALINKLLSRSKTSSPQFLENIWRLLISENLFLQGSLKISVGSSKKAFDTAKWHFGKAAQIKLFKTNVGAFKKITSGDYDAAVVLFENNLKETYSIDKVFIKRLAITPVVSRDNLVKIAIYKKDNLNLG